MSLRQTRVVVIGGTSGIGQAISKAAAGEGASVVVGSSTAERVNATSASGIEAHLVDVKDEGSVERFFGAVGSFDHLVYTAGDWGGVRGGPIESIDLSSAMAMFAVRFWGSVIAVKYARRHLREAGSIILTDGTIAHRPQKGSSMRTAMTGAIEHLVRALAVELAPIRVNGVCPGAIRTGVWDSIPQEQREARFRQMTERFPLKRVGEPNEVAEAYLYLMRAGYTTGQILRVDGGQTAV